jgi:hypothetical protein
MRQSFLIVQERAFSMTLSRFFPAFSFAILTMIPAQAAFITFQDPTVTYLSGTNLIGLDALSLASTTSAVTSGSLTVGLTSPWQVGQLGAASFGEWTNYASSVIETPAPSRVLAQTSAATYTLNFSGIAVRTFGLELAPYDGFDSDFTLRFFSGSTELGSVSRTVGFDFIAGTPTFYARLFAASSLTAITRVEISTTGSWGPVISQLRWSDTALGQPTGGGGEVPEPSTALLLGLGGCLAMFARRSARKSA